MPPTALTTLYTDADDVYALASQEGADLRLDDDDSETTSAAELLRLTTYAINYATSRINDFGLGRYTASVLDENWTVNWWATVIAARYLCARRFNLVPTSLAEAYKEVMEDLKALKAGEYQLGDAAERIVSSPAYKNVRVNVWYRLKRIRVERPISDTTPVRVPEATDRIADIIDGSEF